MVSSGTVTVTVNGEQMGADQADHIGYFWTTLYDSTGNRPGLTSGDQVVLYQDGTRLRSLTLRSISGQINADEDTVTGDWRQQLPDRCDSLCSLYRTINDLLQPDGEHGWLGEFSG